MRRDDTVYLVHMLEMSRKAASKSAAVSHAEFLKDENLQFTLVHLVQVIGEAAGHVSAETRARLRTVPWQQIVGMRHHVVHGYLAVDLEVVWQVARHDLPALVATLTPFVPPELLPRRDDGSESR